MLQLTSFLPFLPLFFFIFFTIHYSRISGTSLLAFCSPSTCGDKEIRYPFWKLSSTASYQYCGYPGFGVDCSATFEPIIHFPNEDFYVKEINYENSSVKLVDIEVTKNQICPRARQNLTLGDHVPLYYNSNLDFNLTFYFNCSVAFPSLPSTYSLNCLSSGTNASYISTARNETKDLPWYEFCDEKVETTVMEMGVGLTDDWVNRFGEAINGGFVLDWRTTKTCAKCENSGGYCGKNNESGLFVCFCTDGSLTFDHCNKGKPSWRTLVSGATVGAVIIFACSIIWHCKFRECSNGSISLFSDRTVHDMNLDIMEQYGSFSPKRYSYFDIKKMTKCFKEKIGQGGYGEVYKGYISESCPVAVKILNTSKGNGEEFINEVSSISRTSHFNVITLLGFCMDRSRRALIYEFLPNGSLEKYISQEAEIQLGIEKLYDISIGTARGLEYLHKGCNTRILHFDIKPHNILLDEDFCPKISDFGLAKLCARKDSIVSMLGARGTIGYIAPEVFSRNFGVVSYKSDVYSYGMMILEMVGGRRNAINGQMTNSSEAYFPHWAYKHVILKEDIKMIKDRVMTEDENKIARKMIIVGLWCIQTDPSQRPTMSKVIEMLEGDLKEMELNPPKPFLYSPSRSGTTSLVTTILPLQNMQTSHSASAEASYKSNECY